MAEVIRLRAPFRSFRQVIAMFFPEVPELDLAARILLLGPLTLLWLTLVTRAVGLRSFSKMTAFDFVSTLATGSLLASAASASEWTGFLQSVLAATAILSTQTVLAWLRRTRAPVRRVLENDPVLLMADGAFNYSVMSEVRVTEADIYAKLRQANVAGLDQVGAVVLETTGDVSVLHGSPLDERLLKHVKGRGENSNLRTDE